MNSGKTPTGKAQHGTIGYTTNKAGKVIINMPRSCFPSVKNQIKVPLGISSDRENHSQIKKAINKLQNALEEGRLHSEDGSFNKVVYQEILKPLGIFPNLRGVMKIVEGGKVLEIKKKNIGLLELWDKYCEYRRPGLAITTYEITYKNEYRKIIERVVNHVNEDSLEVRNWIVKNIGSRAAKSILSQIEKAYSFAIKNDLYHSKNPYLGFSEDIDIKNKNKEIKQEDYKNEDDNLLDKNKSFTWEEVEIILDFLKHHEGRFKRWYHFTAFRFLTGCRESEAQGLWWSDLKWEKECIVFRRSYNDRIKKFKSTKNNTERIFPMPKGGRLWNLLKELKEGDKNECVFVNANRKPLSKAIIDAGWRKGSTTIKREKKYYPGFITQLADEGKLRRYLPAYNTRHTFITHAIYDLGIPSDVVSAWCEHSEEVNKKHYRDVSEYAKRFNPEVSAKAETPELSNDDLRKMVKNQQRQIEELTKLLKEKQ